MAGLLAAQARGAFGWLGLGFQAQLGLVRVKVHDHSFTVVNDQSTELSSAQAAPIDQNINCQTASPEVNPWIRRMTNRMATIDQQNLIIAIVFNGRDDLLNHFTFLLS